jgi:hypothetical protein
MHFLYVGKRNAEVRMTDDKVRIGKGSSLSVPLILVEICSVPTSWGTSSAISYDHSKGGAKARNYISLVVTKTYQKTRMLNEARVQLRSA